MTVSVSSSCRAPFGLSGGGPVYSILGESSSSASCSGPYDYSLFSSGTITCRISIGSSLGSSRVGATSSTLQIWFAYDSSIKQVTFSHAAIPSKSSGGASGGVGGSSGGAAPAPVTPSCTSAPETPILKIERNTTGPKFIFSHATSGPKATSMSWSYTLWNSGTKSWENWASWQSTTASLGSYQASAIEGRTSIAFGVYATNACGSSAQAREAEDRKGISLAAQVEDQITRNTKSNPDLFAGQDVDLYLIATSKLNLELTANSLTTSICTIELTQILLRAPGTCRITVSSISYDYELGAKPTEIQFEVVKLIEQVIPAWNLKSSYYLSDKEIELLLQTDAYLPVRFKSLSPETCEVLGSLLWLVSTGSCIVEASQEGDDKTLAAPFRNFEIWIDSNPTKTITCLKGKVSKKVTGVKPKCPSGYKVKK